MACSSIRVRPISHVLCTTYRIYRPLYSHYNYVYCVFELVYTLTYYFLLIVIYQFGEIKIHVVRHEV